MPPDFIAEGIGSGTDCLLPGGVPIDVATVPTVSGPNGIAIKTLAAGSIVNRIASVRQNYGPFKVWPPASGTPEALIDFYLVAFTVTDIEGLSLTPQTLLSSGDPGCNVLRPGTLIYEDRLPPYFALLAETDKEKIRDKYPMLLARRVVL